MDSSSLEEMIKSAIADADVEALDLQGSGDHFEVTVVTDQFEGRSLVERHRMVYQALGDSMDGAIHALTIKALTPSQYRDGLVGSIDRS